MTLAIFEMRQQSVESSIDMSPQIAQTGVFNKDAHEYGDRGNTNGKGDLNGLIGHRCHQHTL